MREMKFRQWRDGRMIPIHTMYSDKSGIETAEHGNFNFIYDEILMQFTGLKCRGNTEVYESDLLINPSGEVGLVVFYEGGFYLKCPRKSGRPFFVALTSGFLANKTQIGNIHQNPDLWKGGSNG